MEESKMVKGMIIYKADVDNPPDLTKIVEDYAGDGFAMLVMADNKYATLLLKSDWLKRFKPTMKVAVAGDYLAPGWGSEAWQRSATETGWFFRTCGNFYLSGWRFRTVTLKDLRQNWLTWETALAHRHKTTVKVHWL